MFGQWAVFSRKCALNGRSFKVTPKSINCFVFSGSVLTRRTELLVYAEWPFICVEHSVHRPTKHGPALSPCPSSNHRFHDGNKAAISHRCSTIECATMRWIYYSFVSRHATWMFIVRLSLLIENARLRSSATHISEAMPQSSLLQTIRSAKSTCPGTRCCSCGERGSQVILCMCVRASVCVSTYVSHVFPCYVRYFSVLSLLIETCSFCSSKIILSFLSIKHPNQRTPDCSLFCSFLSLTIDHTRCSFKTMSGSRCSFFCLRLSRGRKPWKIMNLYKEW